MRKTHGSPELNEDAAKLAVLGADAGPTIEDFFDCDDPGPLCDRFVIPTEENNYERYRGKCREFCEQAVRDDPTLTLVRGHYICPIWGIQAHWWTRKADGTIYDPTRLQFPSRGSGEYVEHDGTHACEHCGKVVREEDVYAVERHVYCSGECYYRDVM